ncbi:TetR/AcrR family transcriptional regulator [Cumulibacter manganitolerans]|uniref:TetR/AcrR family transcriptional regulator n=1 Tax=Cumulibacter manganitolerans TaxID=1884992 RepID=UPI001294924D|nr:TetR/AcrR family transcriptional regulator [Cumulibacter manganitolerans]
MSRRRDQLIDAAEQVFASKGYAETTMADLAEAAGVTRPTVYAYFSSKDEVLAVVAGRVREHFIELQDQSGRTPHHTFELTLRAYIHEWVRHYGVLTVIAHQALGDPAYAALLEDIHRRTNRRHEKYMQRLVDEGLAHPVIPPRVIAELVTGAAKRFAQLISADPSTEEAYGDALVRAHSAMLGLVASSPLAAPTAAGTER